jgi:aldehyde dehydrogenase (NAD+)
MAFTGSTVTGRKVMESSSNSNLKKLQLELGGKSAQIVCADADLKNAAFWAHGGIFNNHGQSCNAGSRVLVQEDVFEEFLALFVEETKKIVIGDPFNEDTFQGPQISKAQFDKILNYVKIGQEEGATLHYGGKRWGDKGYYIEPTIFINCKNSMRIMQEEVFGPFVSMATFKTIDEAIEMANDSSYGLAGGVYTKDVNVAIRVSNEIKAGTVWVNCFDVFDQSTPFGGYKQSGFGKELGKYALQEYTQVKTVKFQLNM